MRSGPAISNCANRRGHLERAVEGATHWAICGSRSSAFPETSPRLRTRRASVRRRVYRTPRPSHAKAARRAVDRHRRPRGNDARCAGALGRVDGSVQVARLTPSVPAFVFAAVPGPLRWRGPHGPWRRTHTGGVDHCCFLLGLLLLVRGLGLRGRPSPPLPSRTASRWRPLRSVGCRFHNSQWKRSSREHPVFGERNWPNSAMLPRAHGALPVDRGVQLRITSRLGFAGALREVGLPGSDIPLALFAFNAGVGNGQLLFVAMCFWRLPDCGAVLRGIPGWRVQLHLRHRCHAAFLVAATDGAVVLTHTWRDAVPRLTSSNSGSGGYRTP